MASPQPVKQRESSLMVFRKHIVRHTLPDGTTSIDASAIHSVEAYNDWLKSRGSQLPTDPGKIFQRTITSHLSGTDGRVSFDPKEEAAILEVLRRKSPWPCFAGTPFEKKGSHGYRSLGFHEKRRLRKFDSAAAAATAVDASPAVISTRSHSLAPPPSPQRPEATPGSTGASLQASTSTDSAVENSVPVPIGGDTDIEPLHTFTWFPQGAEFAMPPSDVSGSDHFDLQPSSGWVPETPIQSKPTSSIPTSQPSADAFPHSLSFVAQDQSTTSDSSTCSLAFLSALINAELPQSPTLEHAIHHVDAFRVTYPNQAVLVLNTLGARNLAEFFLAQSDCSVRWIGAVACSHSGVARALINAHEIPGFIRSLLFLAQGGVGREVDLVCNIILVEGMEQLMQLKMRQGAHGLVCIGAKHT